MTDPPTPPRSESPEVAQALLDRLAAAEPTLPRRLGELIERLAAEGLLHSAGPSAADSAARRVADPALQSPPIRGLAFDSRQVRTGWLFVAVPGVHVDGHDFLASAAELGAAAAIV